MKEVYWWILIALATVPVGVIYFIKRKKK